MKTTTVRVPDDEFLKLEAIAAVRRTSVSDVIRTAIVKLTDECASDETFIADLNGVAADFEARSKQLVTSFTG